MLGRREFVALAAAARITDLGKIRTRKTGKVEVVFKSPGTQPNSGHGFLAPASGLDQGLAHLAVLDELVRTRVCGSCAACGWVGPV